MHKTVISHSIIALRKISYLKAIAMDMDIIISFAIKCKKSACVNLQAK